MSSARLVWVVAVLALVAAGLAGPVPVAAQEGKDWAGVWEATGQPVSGRTEHAAVRLDDGQVLVTGDNPDERGRTAAELYDPETGEWSATDPMHHGRANHSLVKLRDGRILAIGTSRVAAPPEPFVPEVYDPAASAGQRWTEVADVPLDRVLAAILLDGPACESGTPPDWCGTVLATGTALEASSQPAAALFDPHAEAEGSGSWVMAAAPTQFGVGMVRLDGQRCNSDASPEWCGKVLATRGESVELFDPSVVDVDSGVVGEWLPTGGLVNPRSNGSFTVLRDGRVLAAGGFSLGDDEPVAAAELYDPDAGTWQHTASLAEADRVGHTATLLDDGSVLVAGGRNDERDCFASAEVFDPSGDDGVAGNAPGAFVAGGLMGQPRASHTATALTDGRVLVAGGYESGGCGRNTADVYTPAFLDPQVPAPQVTALDPPAGLVDGGVEVRVSGANLSGASAVMFGETAAEYSVVSNSQITAVAPAGTAGEVTV